MNDSQFLAGFMKMARTMGVFPQELEPYVGKEVTVCPEGIPEFRATIRRGPSSYVAWGEDINLQLYVGHAVVVKTDDGKAIDLGKIQT